MDKRKSYLNRKQGSYVFSAGELTTWQMFKQQLYGAFFNPADQRFWLRTIIFSFVESIILIVQLGLNFHSEPIARVMMIMALILYALITPSIVRIYLNTRTANNEYMTQFRVADSNQDGILDRAELLKLSEKIALRTLPLERVLKGSKQEFTYDDILRYNVQTAKNLLRLYVIEFAADWLSYWASLMLFSPNDSSGENVFSAIMGVLALIDIFYHLNETYLHAFSNYVSRTKCIRSANQTFYVIAFSGLAFVLCLMYFLDYGMSQGTIASFSGPNKTNTDLGADFDGFILGIISSAAVIIWSMAFFLHVAFCNCCHCLKFMGNNQLTFNANVLNLKVDPKTNKLIPADTPSA